MTELGRITPDSPAAVINRELSWLSFARRVLALAEDPGQPLLERVKFAAIMGTIYDEFAMKRIGGLLRQVRKGSAGRGPDGLTPAEVLEACRAELRRQQQLVATLVDEQLRPALRDRGLPILDVADLGPSQRDFLTRYCMDSVEPILVPLATDAAHPFPFISNLGLNLAVLVSEPGRRNHRFVRIKVPANRPRWVPLPDQAGWVPLEQVIAENLSAIFPRASASACHFFRVTRGAKDDPWTDQVDDEDAELSPGAIIGMVTAELTARKYAGVVRLEVSADTPAELRSWLAAELGADPADVIATPGLLSLGDLMDLPAEGHAELRAAPHEPVTHPRLRGLDRADPAAVFDEIRRGDILVHLPYHKFDTSILRFLQSAAVDPAVLAIKLTIYRTGRRSPIIQALKEAARRGKQVAVLVEITARFDEAPNISWGKELEEAGAHVAYGVERVKTHVKLALVVRQEPDGIRRYVHVGTGNYHEGTARLYEDLGLLSADPDLSAHAAAVFNELTAGIPAPAPGKLLVAPHDLRERFIEAIRREAEHARAGRPCGIQAKMNQLQDPQMIRELYLAGLAGVPIVLNVRGLCCLRAAVPGLSPTIKVFSVLGRFLEHSRIYRFENGGTPEFFIGSADWMTRNLSRRMEVVAPVCDPVIKAELDAILHTYEEDNCSAWDMQPDGEYLLRHPAAGESRRAAQEVFVERSASSLRPRGTDMTTGAPEIERIHGPGAAAPRGSHDPPLHRHPSAGEVVLTYLGDQVAAIARYDPLVRRDEPDAVHQMRVATRRARSALQAFGSVIDREATRPLCEELKWVGGALGQARDTEVMLDRLTASLAGIPPALVEGPVEARITAHFGAELAQATKTGVAALDGRRYRRLRGDLDGLLLRPPLTPLAERRAGKVLAKPVRRAGRRLLRALAAVPAAEDRDTALHEARKAAKRARYAAEAVVPALGSAAGRQAAAAKDLQEVLGDHHDSVVARTVLLDLAAEAREAGEDTFTYGLMYQREAGRAASMEEALPPFTVEELP